MRFSKTGKLKTIILKSKDLNFNFTKVDPDSAIVTKLDSDSKLPRQGQTITLTSIKERNYLKED